jgi:eukaryotic-like serine/threonine-protein kinase
MDEADDDKTIAADFYMAALWDAARPPMIGVPGYEILSEISRGGMGAVYHARQLRPQREVAVKVLLPEFAEVPEMLARFQLEARAMAALDHPGILPVYEVGEAEGMPYFTMKLADGGTLSDRVLAGGMPPKEAAALMIHLARAVHHAHQHGVLHRDLKPGNFLFMEDGRACVSDFGLAKLSIPDHRPLTRTESFFGTPHYMPPEVATGSAAQSTVAGDLYSMGAVFYECLTGRKPHPSCENVAALLRAIADEPITPPVALRPEIPRDLSVICMKALEKNPRDRYATLEDFAADIERWAEGRSIMARPAGMGEVMWRWARRHPLPAGLAAALVLVSLIGGALLASSNSQRGEALAEARQKLHRSLIDQARSERLLGKPGHRQRTLALLTQAAAISKSPEIRDEAVALFARADLSPVPHFQPAPAPPEDPISDDPAVIWKPSPNGKSFLAWHGSGTVRRWRDGQRLGDWEPVEGREIAAAFDQVGGELMLAETSRGLLSVTADGKETVWSPPGSEPVTRFLSVAPGGNRIALARVDGLRVMQRGSAGKSWHHGAAPARCAAAWSGDGSRVAAALGDQRQVLILSAENGALAATIPTGGMPKHLALDHTGGLLAVASDDGMLTVFDAADGSVWSSLPHDSDGLAFGTDGGSLRSIGKDGRLCEWKLALPVAFKSWSEIPRVRMDGQVSDLKISPDGKWLLTVSAGCAALWSVEEARQTGIIELESQRVDDRASAWWLGNSEILIQVPGGLERDAVDAEGRPGERRQVKRVPGATVLDVRQNGDWLVAVMDDLGDRVFELWPSGNPEQAAVLESPPPMPDDPTTEILDGETIIHTDTTGFPLKLTAPNSPGIVAACLSRDGRCLIAVTKTHRVISWDLESLRKALDAAGF